MTTENTNEMAEKLAAAGKKAESQKKARQERVVKGSHLLDKLKEMATASAGAPDEMNGFLKFNSPDKKKRVLIAKKGGRVDLSGFTIEADAIRQISEQEARDKHLGKVRAQLDFGRADDEVLSAFSAALAKLAEPTPEPVKKPKAPKKDAETPTAEA